MEEETEEGEQGGKSKTGKSVNGEKEKEEIVTCKALDDRFSCDRDLTQPPRQYQQNRLVKI